MDTPTMPKRAIPLPEDPVLPALGPVLDGERAREWLASVLPGRAVQARPRYVRYKPANKAVVLYDVEVDGRWTAAVLTVAALRDLRKQVERHGRSVREDVRVRCAAPEPISFLEEGSALVEWYP